MAASSLEQIMSLAKRRGFIFQSSEIYGGAAAAYDYGPLGVELKNNLKRLWWEEMTRRENIVGLDAAIFMHPKVWEASGHVEAFSDPLVECKNCHRRFRIDEGTTTVGGHATVTIAPCRYCGAPVKAEEVRQFNLMFRTHLGPTEESGSTVYLRPETAQGIYVNAPYVQQVMRLALPFGIAQIGKAFRNEITPGHFTFRTVEFEQAEMQFFVKPAEADHWFDFWKEERMRWYRDVLGFPADTIRFYPHAKKELAHYAKAAADIQYRFPMGDQEVEGVHNRGDWDMVRHQEYSGKDLSFFDEGTKEKFLPWIVETSAGVDRVLLAVLVNSYSEETVEGEKRVVLKLPRELAPVQMAVFPLLSNQETLTGKAREVAGLLRPGFRIQLDESGSIGRRYRRQDEIGTPFCVTIDHQTLDDDSVTIRDLHTMRQERVAVPELPAFFSSAFAVRG